MDSDRDVSPFVTDKAGKPLAKNPLKDPRVRKAISKAINRPAMVDKVMEGEAIASGQLVADFLFGATKNLKVEAYDPEGAKKLLAEAGYPDGFGITIHAPNNRYVNDAKIAQAVAQMLTRVGIDTKVVAMPSSTFFTQATDLKFSLMLLGWSTGTGEASSSLKALLMTYNRDKGYGTANRGRYSNTKVDALTEDALQTVDDVKREALPAARDRARDRRHRRRAAALPGQPVGRARRHHLRAAHRREHAGLAVQARGQEVGVAGRRTARRAPTSTDHQTTKGPSWMRRRRSRRSRLRPGISSTTGGCRRPRVPRCRWSTPPTAARSPPSRSAPPRTSRAPSPRRGAPSTGPGGGSRRRKRGGCSRGSRATIGDHAEELALIEARDCGKPLKQARADAAACARYFEYYGGASDKFHGETIPYPSSYTVLTWREPHGVTGHIIPWNYPLQIFGRSVGGGARGRQRLRGQAGRGRVPVAAARRRAGRRRGLPRRRAQHRHRPRARGGRGAGRARRDRSHQSFTGSPPTGATVAAEAARRHCPVTLELGGKGPQVVFADADLDAALPVIVNAIVQNAGQTCSAGSRLLVESSRYEEVLERLGQRFAALRVGPALADLDCGPLIRASQLDRVRGFLAEAERDGIAVAGAGTIAPDAPATGYYVAPQLLRDVPVHCRLGCEEVFGPVLAAMPFTDEADAVRIANATEFGLVAGVWTKDGGRRCGWRARSAAGRCSSTATAPAAASSCRSAASSRPATGGRRASRRWSGSAC